MVIGTINMVTDINLAMQCYSQGCKVIMIAECKDNIPGVINMPILLPPYEALCAEIDGDINSYTAIYYNYLLGTPEAYYSMLTIAMAVLRGVNIILYIENGDNLSHAKALSDFFEQKFGIHIGCQTSNFAINPEYIPVINILEFDYLGGDANNLLTSIPDLSVINMIVSTFPIAYFVVDKIAKAVGVQDFNQLIMHHANLRSFVSPEGKISLVCKQEAK